MEDAAERIKTAQKEMEETLKKYEVGLEVSVLIKHNQINPSIEIVDKKVPVPEPETPKE